MDCVNIDPINDQRWHDLVQVADTDVFQSPPWLRVLGDTYDFVPRANVLVDDDGDVFAGMAFCRVFGVNGERNASLPFSDYSDPIVNSSQDWNRLVLPLLEEETPVTMSVLRNQFPAEDTRFTIVDTAKWHEIDVKPDIDLIWERVSPSARRAIRKARSVGVKLRQAKTRDDLRAFFELHLRVRKYRHRLLAQPYLFFERIFDQFMENDNGVLILAESDGDIVAGVLFLEWKNKLYYKFNAWDPEFSTSRPNDAILWAGIEYCKERGLAGLDLGLSDQSQEGLLRYKRKYASDERDILHLRSPLSIKHEDDESLSFLPALVDLLTSRGVPDSVTEQAGQLLYKLFA